MGLMLTRRWFLQALAASVVAAGMPLPAGFPSEAAALPQAVKAGDPIYVNSLAALGGDGTSWATAFRSLALALKHTEPGGHVVLASNHFEIGQELNFSPDPTRPITVRSEGKATVTLCLLNGHWNELPAISMENLKL